MILPAAELSDFFAQGFLHPHIAMTIDGTAQIFLNL